MKRIGVYATGNQEIHDLISEMFERKTGSKTDGCVTVTHHYLYESDCGVIHGTGYNSESRYGYRLVTLEELEGMPDYVAAKEMTVSEISEKLGYEVKVVK